MNTNERELILNECKSREFISVIGAFATYLESRGRCAVRLVPCRDRHAQGSVDYRRLGVTT